jgi:vitamin B12 transporter
MKPWICAAVLGLLTPSVVHAQEPTDTIELTPVVVTATRAPRPAADVPALVTVLDGEELRARGITTVFEALREVPGATVVQLGAFGGQTSLFLRGGQSNYVKVLVDGVPLNQPGGAFDFANLRTDNVDRIEVLRGPASVLYGSDAVTGVVQIFTRRGGAQGLRNGELTVRGGTYGTLDWEAQTSGGSRKASYSFGVSRLTSDGVFAFNNEYRNTLASGLIRLAPDQRTDATLMVRYHDNIFHFPTNGAGIPKDQNQYNDGSGPTIGLDAGHFFTPRLEARMLVTANNADLGYDNQPDGPGDSNLFHSLDRFRRSSADLRANLHLTAGSVVTAGAAFEQEHDRSTNICSSAFGDCTSPPVDTSRWNRALYAQVVSDVARRMSLVAGVRLEDNQRFGTYATYRAGAVYRLTASTRMRMTAGSSFREPTFYENFATGFSTGNPDLKPEHAHSWEVGLEQSVARGRARFSGTFFDQRFVDMIDYDPSVSPPTPNYENIAGATARGVELGIHVTPGRASLGLSYVQLSTRVTNPGFDSTSGAALAAGQPLVRRPKHSARLDADYRWRERGTAALTVTYVGDRQDQDFATFPFPRVTLPSYTRVDLAGEIQLLRSRGTAPGLAATVRIENLFGAAYEEVRNFKARGRTILIGARLRFGY